MSVIKFDKAWVDVSFDFHKNFGLIPWPPHFESWFRSWFEDLNADPSLHASQALKFVKWLLYQGCAVVFLVVPISVHFAGRVWVRGRQERGEEGREKRNIISRRREKQFFFFLSLYSYSKLQRFSLVNFSTTNVVWFLVF